MNFFKNVEGFILSIFSIFGRIYNKSILGDEDFQIDFKNYHRYSTMMTYLKKIVKKNKEIASFETIGESVEGREINVIKISSDKKNGKKPIIFVDAGIHAREWLAPATALYLIQQLLENPDNSQMYTKFDWFIIPLVNPDGYEYSYTEDRCWRKNRRKGKDADGVDNNRNFSFMWGQQGSSDEESSKNYRGTAPFSEPESRAIRDLALKHKEHIKMYISLHSHGKMILHPWGYTKETVKDLYDLLQVAKMANRAIKEANGKPYRVGSSATMLYLISGGSRDYFRAEIGVKYAYTIELPGGGKHGFDFPPEQIEDAVTEIFEGFKGFWKALDGIY